MPADSLKIQVLRNFSTLIQAEVPSLAGRVIAGPPRREQKQSMPCLTLLPGPTSFRYIPDYPSEFDEAKEGNVHHKFDPTTIIFNTGRYEGTTRLTLIAKSHFSRMEFEEDLLEMFMRGAQSIAAGNSVPARPEMRPGIVLVDTTPSGTRVYNTRSRFELLGNTWRNERTFSNEYRSVLDVTTTIPAFAKRTNSAYVEITDLRINLTEDLETPVTVPADLANLDDLETYRVNEDGTITEV